MFSIRLAARLILVLAMGFTTLIGVSVAAGAMLPRGEQLAYVFSADPGSDVYVAYVMDINHSLSTPFIGPTVDIGGLAWSPSGDQLIFIRDHQLYLVNGDGSGMRPLHTSDDGADVPLAGLPQWSPDGRQISVPTERGPLMISPDGSRIEPITIDPRLQVDSKAIRELAWSPDGRYLAFAIGAAPFAYGIMVMDAVGSTIPGGSHEVTQASFIPVFAWSPDGALIATLVVQQNRFRIQLADVTGSAPPVVLPPPADANSLKWSPDGRQIAFVSGSAVCVVSVSSGASNCITPPIKAYILAWSPDGRQIAVDAEAGYYLMNADGSDLHLFAAYDGPVLGLSWRP